MQAELVALLSGFDDLLGGVEKHQSFDAAGLMTDGRGKPGFHDSSAGFELVAGRR